MATVLVADDSAYARRVLRQALEGAGYEVLEAPNGMSAIEIFFLRRPEVVLLDLTMGDLDGLEVLRRVRDLAPDARVIVVSADVQRTTAESVMAAGALQFLGKPAGREQVVEAVASALAEVPE
jgi:two-component system chemotaxis response regulator CheY